MDSQSCNAFTMGFCPNEEFYVEAVTNKCPLPHVSAERENYQNQHQIFPFELKTLEAYKSILKEVDKKIEVKKNMLKKEIMDESHYSALSKCQQIIDFKSTDFDNFENIHSLLIIHGKLIKDVIDSKDNKKYSVCHICSSFIEKELCEHMFCSRYKSLREIVKRLEIKISRAMPESQTHLQ